MSNEMSNELKLNDENVEIIEVVGEILKSRTQSVKVIVLKKDNEKFVSIQKWWRKSSEEPWLEGKGFHLNLKETVDVQNFLAKALELT